MNASLLSNTLFAKISSWQRLGDGLYRGRGRTDFMDFLPVIAVLAVVAIAFAVFTAIRKRNDMSQQCDDPNKLFRELSQAHELDHASQKLLWQLATALQLAQPAEVFLKPALFQAGLPQELCGERAEYKALQERLF